MLDDVDATLRQLLLSQVPGITSPAQVRFQPRRIEPLVRPLVDQFRRFKT